MAKRIVDRYTETTSDSLSSVIAWFQTLPNSARIVDVELGDAEQYPMHIGRNVFWTIEHDRTNEEEN